jgi:hypothetical protein
MERREREGVVEAELGVFLASGDGYGRWQGSGEVQPPSSALGALREGLWRWEE